MPLRKPAWPISEEKVGFPYAGRPEPAALKILTQGEWVGSYSEGHTLRSIFRALIMPVITEYQPFKRIDPDTPYMHAIHYLVPMVAGGGKWTNYVHSLQPSAVIQMMHDSIDCRLVSDPEELQVDFDKIAQKIKILTSTPPPAGLAIYKFISAVPVDFWHRLLDIYAVGDGLLSSGWPDLEIADGNEVHCVEVKTTDRVSAHQANTMQILVRLGITCRVFRLINTSA